MANVLYYGDNLDILRRYITDKSVDLIYLDPPFKSDQDSSGSKTALVQQHRYAPLTILVDGTHGAAAAYQNVVRK